MKARIIGYNEFKKESFSYEIDNVVCVSVILENILINFIDETGKPQTTMYNKNNVKIVIEN